MASNYFIKHGYRVREAPIYFDDVVAIQSDIVWQPDVYLFAAYLARRFRCPYIIDIGCGAAQKLVGLHPEFQVIGVDFKDNITYCQKKFPFGQWVEWDLDEPGVIPIESNVLSNSVIISSDVIEHLIHPVYLLENLRICLNYAPVALLSTPERDLTRGLKDAGPPINRCHVREWNQSELESLLRSYDFHIEFLGLTRSNNDDSSKRTSLAVLGNNQQPKFCPAPVDFRVISILTASNEEDIILPSLNYLISNGIEVYVINSGSNDATGVLARSLLGKGVIGVDDFQPESSASSSQQDECLLARIAEISNMLKANWFIHQKANELRESPWPWTTLKDAIYYVDQCGFNCIDHTILNFYRMGDGFRPCPGFSAYYKYYEWAPSPDRQRQVNVWKQLDQQVYLTHEGDANNDFEGCNIFPYKFLIKKYNSISQGNSYTLNLSLFDPFSFYKNFLVERLSSLKPLCQDAHNRSTESNANGIKRLLKEVKVSGAALIPLITRQGRQTGRE